MAPILEVKNLKKLFLQKSSSRISGLLSRSKEAKQYIHRVGRTARAGADGRAVNILSQRDHDNFRRVLREFNDMTITKQPTPQIERVNIVIEHQQGGYGRQGPRGPRQHFGERHRRY